MAGEWDATRRRPLTTRDAAWAKGLAARLARAGVSPNSISIASVGFAAVAGAAFVAVPHFAGAARAALFVAAAAGMQLRLAANLLDGMVAIEGGRASKSGEIYNELPDRVSDVAILLCAGFAAGEPWGTWLGWSCALLALMTAYVRALGVTAGASSAFQGPMAKPHRMATLTVACLLSALAVWFEHPPRFLFFGLCVVAAGAALTVARRTLRIVRELESR